MTYTSVETTVLCGALVVVDVSDEVGGALVEVSEEVGVVSEVGVVWVVGEVGVVSVVGVV